MRPTTVAHKTSKTWAVSEYPTWPTISQDTLCCHQTKQKKSENVMLFFFVLRGSLEISHGPKHCFFNVKPKIAAYGPIRVWPIWDYTLSGL